MKDIKGYEGLYAITEDGLVWKYPSNTTWKKGMFMKYFLIGHGYKVASLYINKKMKKFLIHRLVAQTYISNPLNLPEVNHKNANRLDNRVQNLEWVSSKQNKQHAIKLGLYKNLGKNSPKGSKCIQAILNEDKVKNLRKMFSSGKYKRKHLAEIFGVNYSTVCGIILHNSWKHI